MRRRAVGVLLAAVVVLGASGCSGADPAPDPAPSPSAAPVVPAYDASLEPAAAVLPLVPEAAVTLTVTDYDEVRDDLGITDLSTASPVAEQDDFWARATAGAPLLSTGLLRPADARLRAGFAISQTDVSWEAHFFDDTGAELGWVLAFRAGTDVAAVQAAVAAGAGPLGGSTVVPDALLVTKGVSADGLASWAADADTEALVGLPAVATYVERACVPRDPVPTALEPLDQYSVQFESTLATARLGEGRTDLFERMRLSSAFAPFAAAYAGGVADPLTGRIGFRMTDPPTAADLALRRRLPFAACAS